MEKKRQSSIELLRILTILGVVIMHCNGEPGGALAAVHTGSVNFYLLHFLESVFICAVNVFVLITGYFLCTGGKRSWWKAIRLVVQVMVFSAGLYLLSAVRGGGFSLRGLAGHLVPANYFVILYVALYLISPYLNLVVRGLRAEAFRKCLILLGLVFAVWSTVIDLASDLTGTQWMGLSTVALSGTQNGYSIVNFVMMYLIGAYLRTERTEKIAAGKLLLAFFGNAAVLTVLACGGKLLGLQLTSTLWAYCNPLVMVNAVLIFQLFRQLELKPSGVINRLASGAFSVYLLHAALVGMAGIAGRANGSSLVLMGLLAAVAVGSYLVCWCAHAVYRFVTEPIFRKLEARFPLFLPEV